MSHRLAAFVALVACFTTAPIRATEHITILVEPNQTVGAGFGELPPGLHTLRITIQANSGTLMSGMGMVFDQTGSTMWSLESSTATTETFVAHDVAEDDMGWIQVTGIFEDPAMMMTDGYTVRVANALFPCGECGWDPVTLMPACEHPVAAMVCDADKEGEIEIAPGSTQSLGAVVHRGPAGTFTIEGASGDLQIKNADGSPFTSVHLDAYSYWMPSLILEAGANFTGSVQLTCVFLPDDGVLDSRDIVHVYSSDSSGSNFPFVDLDVLE